MNPVFLPLPFLLAVLSPHCLVGSSTHLEPDRVERLDASLAVGENGERLPFRIDLERTDGTWRAFLINDPERIEVPEVAYDGSHLRLALPHYRSVILAERQGASDAFVGTWTKVRGAARIAKVPFEARLHVPPPARRVRRVLPKNVAGRWAVHFESDENEAVGVFQQEIGDDEVHGTFLTATGDYRYLVGRIEGADLELSCFDGAHAFLFRATVGEDGTLSGAFWSGNWWNETWTARRDPAARVVDAFAQTRWNEEISLADLAFPNTDGEMVSLARPDLRAKARMLVLFGTWCPNCNDEAPYLAELQRTFGPRGLSIVGLAFELTGHFEEDAHQVELFRDRYSIPFPLLLAGTADKAAATEAFAALDRVRSFPTTIFLTWDGRVEAIHSGYAGPATGRAHEELRRAFETHIERLLSESDAQILAETVRRFEALSSSSWWEETPDGEVELRLQRDGGSDAAIRIPHPLDEEAGKPLTSEAVLLGDALWIGNELWKVDAAAEVILDPFDAGRRMHPKGNPTPLLFRKGISTPGALLAALAAEDPKLRREALYALALEQQVTADGTDFLVEALRLLADPSLGVRRTAAWTLGRSDDERAVGALLDNLDDPNRSFRREVARALHTIAARRGGERPPWLKRVEEIYPG